MHKHATNSLFETWLDLREQMEISVCFEIKCLLMFLNFIYNYNIIFNFSRMYIID